MRRALLGLYTYLEFLACCVAVLPLVAVSALRYRGDPGRRRRGRWLRRLGRWSTRLTPLWRFEVEGAPPDDIRRRGYVVIANHESTADPFLLSFLPFDMRFIAKAELFRPPLVGWLLRLGGDIPIRRRDRASARRMAAECEATVRSGMPVMLFPEGTRSADGTLLPFKEGAFRIAVETQAPLLPVALCGTRRCRPKGSWWFGTARAVARVLPPISTTGLTLADVPKLMSLARARIEGARAELETELEPAPGSSRASRREPRIAPP
ncbi:MAG: lysophospholipid acyltransferase family protein [Myxococcales bacterium]